MGVSLKPSDAVQGGGLIDDVDVTIKSCRFKAWDYNGALPQPVLGLSVDFDYLDVTSGQSAEANQVYSAGDMKHFVPSQDGRMAVAVGGKTGLNENTNAMLFLVSLVNCGFPENKIGDDVSVFEGTHCHVTQVPQPKRGGAAAGGDKKTVLVVSKIHKFPWDAGQAVAKTKAPAKKAEAVQQAQAGATPAGNGEAVAMADQTLMAILVDKGGEIAGSAVAAEAFKRLIAHPLRTPVVQMIFTPEYLGAPGKPWSFDGSMVKLG
jgi:hypothetical protein